MRRRLFNLAAGVSLMLCAATVVLWIRSYYVADAAWWYGAEHSWWRPVYSLSVESGQLRFGWMTETGAPSMRRSAYVSNRARRTLHDDWVWERLPRPCRWIGVGWTSGDSTGYEIDRSWYVQVRSLTILATAPLLVALANVYGACRRTGSCPRCGYDLRATPNRCPECGTAVAGAVAGANS